jgi:hypothetical protein
MIARTTRALLAGMVALGIFSMAPAASAGGNEVIKEGSCSGSTDWKLKLKDEDGGIEVEFEVDSNVSGQDWKVKIFQNGDKIYNKTRTTHGASGSFEVNIVADDTPGVDKFRGRAKNPNTGELCVGKAQF